MTMAANAPNDVFQPFKSPGVQTDLPKEIPKDLEDFDPFQIGASAATRSPTAAPKKSLPKAASGGASVASKANTKLAPRLEVKFKLHEEVTSFSDLDGENEGSSEIVVDGTVQAQVTSSDALKNSPFILAASSPLGTDIPFIANEEYAKVYSSQGQTAQVNVIKVPKSAVGFVTVGKFSAAEKVAHMPMLLERKITRSKAKVQIAVQVRSKLSNPDDMKEMSIALAMSDRIAGDTVEINTGEGEWDRLTRTIIWKLDRLPKGESFMVSARARLTEENEEIDTLELEFPVLLRCQCNDQISSSVFKAIEASGYPATVTSATVQRSFRIVHRLH